MTARTKRSIAKGFFVQKKQKRGNQLSFDDGWQGGVVNMKLVIKWLNELSVERHFGELYVTAAAAEGVDHKELICDKASTNNVEERVRGGRRGMGIGMICTEVLSGSYIVVHPRAYLTRPDLSGRTLTTQSGDRQSKYGLLWDHWVLPVLCKKNKKGPVLYGLYSMKELDKRGLLSFYTPRKTRVHANLASVPLSHWLGKLEGFGQNPMEGMDVVDRMLHVIKIEKGSKIKNSRCLIKGIK